MPSALARFAWVLLFVATACSRETSATSADGVEAELLRSRFTGGRLAHQPAGRACAAADDDSALVPRSRCDADRTRADDATNVAAVVRLAHAATTARGADSTVAALHTTALVELRWGAARADGAGHAVDALERAARRAPNDVVVLNDLAVAQLARAEREQRLWPLVQALDALERARPATPAVLFNRALVLERLSLDASARRAWADYLAVEREPAWRAEAEAHRERLTRAPAAPRSPQQLREAGFARLGEWGRAVQRGDTLSARRALAAAHAAADSIADSIVAAPGDRALALALHAVDADTLRARPALARAHADFADGTTLYAAAAYERAASAWERAESAMRAAGSPTARWAAVQRAFATAALNRLTETDALVDRVLGETADDEPALRGRALWVRGLSQGRRGAFEAASRNYRAARDALAPAGEREGVAALSLLLTESSALSGQTASARAEALVALRRLAPERSSFFATLLGLIAGDARADALPNAALDLMREVVDVGTAADRPVLVAWAHGERARDLVALDRGAEARAELAEAERWTARVGAGHARDALGAAQSLLRGQILRAASPRAARDTLRRVVRAYRALGDEVQLPNGLYQAALAARDAGDAADSRRLLEEAVGVIEARRGTFTSAEVRASYYETTELVFDALIALELDASRPDAAFALLERERAAAWTSRGAPRPAPLGVADVRRALGRGATLLEYALLPDRLVVWTLTRDGVRARAVPVGRDSVVALVRRFGDEAGAPTSTPAQARAALYDLLVRPTVAAADSGELSVVPDRELSAVPFAALWDRETGRALVERHAVRTLPSAEFAVSAAALGSPARAPLGALVVGDPALDTLALPQLPRLPGAGREAARVAAIYGDARVLLGDAARLDSVRALLPTRAVFHFAGHAVADAERPELSFLALASADSADDGMLRAREIATLRLSNLRIVVLSACRTLGQRSTHVGAVAGLAYSFLRAGTPATVSSLWDVDDETSSALLVAFHRHLAAGRPAVEALRAAQLEALGAGRAALRAPRAWAAFVYTGP